MRCLGGRSSGLEEQATREITIYKYFGHYDRIKILN